MAYPTNLDSFTANVDNVDVIYASDVNELQTAITSLEAKVGADSSAVTTSHDYKLSGVTGSDKAVSKTGTETLTNKTLTSPVLNTPVIAMGSDANGDILYRTGGAYTRLPIGTDGKILKVVSSLPSWQTETVTNDASTTVKGIVEAATSSEVTAGTATGGTGAVLAVTPDALAASTPVFNGSGLTNLPLVIGTKISTIFETSGRFSSTGTGTAAGTATFGTNGLALNGTNGGGSSAGSINTTLSLTNASNDLYVNSPLFHVCVSLGDQDSNNNTAHAYFGIGNLTVATSGITFTGRHIGFKFIKSAGTINLYATQADNTTENVSSSLTTASQNDIFDLYFKVNGTSSVDYYWRKNGGSLSSATNLTSNLPTTTTLTLQCAVSTVSTVSNSNWTAYSMSYERK